MTLSNFRNSHITLHRMQAVPCRMSHANRRSQSNALRLLPVLWVSRILISFRLHTLRSGSSVGHKYTVQDARKQGQCTLIVSLSTSLCFLAPNEATPVSETSSPGPFIPFIPPYLEGSESILLSLSLSYTLPFPLCHLLFFLFSSTTTIHCSKLPSPPPKSIL